MTEPVRKASQREQARAILIVGALALRAAASCDAAVAEAPPLPPPRPADLIPAPEPKPALQPPAPAAPGAAAPTCLSRLVAEGAHAEAAPAPAPAGEGCKVETPIRLSSVTLADGDLVKLTGEPLLDCGFALVVADYVRLIVAPLGEAMLRAKITAIETGPGYECRSRDHIAGEKISAHAKGLALDIFAVDFADRRRVAVERQGGVDEQSYFRAMRSAACGWFTTVLGPGADAFHANHMHLDIESHGPSGSYRICE